MRAAHVRETGAPHTRARLTAPADVCETEAMANTDNSPARSAAEQPSRGHDDRRATVDPAQNPAPSSPPADEDAVRRGEDNLDRVISK